MKKLIIWFGCFFFTFHLYAQDTLQNNTGLRANEKIYVVGAVVLAILIGLIIYLVRLDRKITRLEKKHPQ